MVRVAVLQALADGRLHAGHVGLARPIPLGQVAGVAVVVGLGHVRHVEPIHAANELPPAQHLADEALDTRQRQAACVVSLLGCRDDFTGVEQVQVQAAAHQRVPAKGQRGPHGVLPGAKVFQALIYKVLQRHQRVFSGDRPGKVVQRARVLGKACLHQDDHVLRDAVGGKAGRRGHDAWAFGTKAFAVVGIKIPLAADGLFALHQDAEALAHLAVKELHAKLFFVARPFGKLGAAAQKVCIAHPPQQHFGLLCSVCDELFHAPSPRLHHHQGFGWMLLQRFG